MGNELLLAIYCCGVITGIFVIEPLFNIAYILIKKLISKWRNKNDH